MVPKEHNGVLVRIKGASGTLFDPTFMGYQVSEQTRLKQLVAEIFVFEGLENALTIDRESFNYANVHYQYISRWLHGAIRQFANKHKAISSRALVESREASRDRQTSRLESIALESWRGAPTFSGDEPPRVVFARDQAQVEVERASGVRAFSEIDVLGRLAEEFDVKQLPPQIAEALRAVAVILEANGLLKDLDFKRQEKVLLEIGRVLLAGGGR